MSGCQCAGRGREEKSLKSKEKRRNIHIEKRGGKRPEEWAGTRERKRQEKPSKERNRGGERLRGKDRRDVRGSHLGWGEA